MTSSSTGRRANENAAPFPNLGDSNEVLKFFGIALVSMVAMKIAFQAFFIVYILAFPLAFFYAVQQCPSNESFDAKKELKRVMRGCHLGDDHPDKPKGLVEETLRRAQASVATEIVTLPGYEITIYDIIGACKLVILRVPTIGRDCYWIGAFGKWNYLFARDLNQEKGD